MPEDVRVAALEPDDEPRRCRLADEDPVDLTLRDGVGTGLLADVDEPGTTGRRRGAGACQQLFRVEPVVHDHVGMFEQVAATHGDEVALPGPAPTSATSP